MEYGLIGLPLGHSFSKPIHERLGGYAYELCPVTEREAAALLRSRAFKGLNVTIPYKRFVIPFCDELDPAARAIGAVNTIVNRGGRLVGYNTDFDGFRYLANSLGVSFRGKTTLILGGGATRRTIAAAAHSEGAARILSASRTPGPDCISYAQARGEAGVQILVNATPVGMYPQVDDCPIDPAAFPALEAVLDVVYNPLETRLVQAARALGLPAGGGLAMLVAQAKYAADRFLDTVLPEAPVSSITREIWAQRANLVLIGMPGSGKTSLGKALAKRLGRPFVDTDALVVQEAGQSIEAIFARQGEAAFRDLEEAATARVSKETGQVISTGGGAVLRRANVERLRQNGVLVHIYRPPEQLPTGGGRPLSQSRADNTALWQARAPLYAAAAHCQIENTGSTEPAAQRAYEAFLAAAWPPTPIQHYHERKER